MCGIAGVVDAAGIDASELTRMSDALRHRGPDGLGFLLHDGSGPIRIGRERPDDAPATVGFAHRRLTIIDLSSHSDQPMVDPGGRLGLIYNGELYNYVELRSELEARGHRFTSDGDTEVLLRAYAEWGEDCVRHFVGMWAFAILDLERRALFLSRDRFGIKPLYFHAAGGRLRFASEIKALLAAGIEPQPDAAAVASFLLEARTDDGEGTFFSGVRQLPPAHIMTLDLAAPSTPRIRSYWELPGERPGAGAGAPERFAELLRDSIRIHARSDVPVGTCLSGGLDSSGIVCLAEELRDEGRIPRYAHAAYGYVPSDGSVSEREHMEEVVRRTGVLMTFVNPSPEEYAAALPEILAQQDEPFGSASIAAQWFVFAAAKDGGMKVMLDGQGADEVLGGYPAYLEFVDRSLGARLGARAPGPLRGAGRALRDALRGPRWPDGADLVTTRLREVWAAGRSDAGPPRSLAELLARETRSTSLPALLRYEDRNSMAHSIEARVPYLDHRLVELAFELPESWRIDAGVTKRVLREALRGVIPETIRARRDKVGFRADPSLTWGLVSREREWIAANRGEHEQRWFDEAAVRRLLDRGDRSTASEFLVWRLLSVKSWLRAHWGGD